MGQNIQVGGKFGRWTIIGESSKSNKLVMCRCDCGKEKDVYVRHLLSGASKSCGCYMAEASRKRMNEKNPTVRKHGMWKSRLYSVWSNMKCRCTNPNDSGYSWYGGRGISVCDEWKDFNAFQEWALMNGYNDTLTLDRIDPDGNYEPSNCRFITIQRQQYNKRTNHLITYNGKTQTLTEWADERGIKRNTLDARINRSHWEIGRALGYE